MSATYVQDYVIRTYGFEADETIEAFRKLEQGAEPATVYAELRAGELS